MITSMTTIILYLVSIRVEEPAEPAQGRQLTTSRLSCHVSSSLTSIGKNFV